MKITDAGSFGRAVRERRKELHYTQAYLSACTGLSISFISDLERGKPGIQLEKAIQVVNILGMDLLMEKRGE
ncbi:MAG: helix-turn-helix domain-containing protein [Lachnospiraceae bacterium]|nr:helix-turn-helix domain-containing protein [Lachnospiraceae bacterium]